MKNLAQKSFFYVKILLSIFVMQSYFIFQFLNRVT